MDLLEFSTRLDRITSTPIYQESDEYTQQEILRRERDEFIQSNPNESENANILTENRYKDFRRNTGQGRYIPDGVVAGPWTSPDFTNLSEEDKLESIKDFRSKIPDLASEDRINQEDLEYYYSTVSDIYERQVRGEDTGWVADKAYRAWDGMAGFLADAVGASDTADSIRRFSRENPKYDEDLTAMLSEGLGSVGASMAIFVGGSLLGAPAGPGGATVGGVTTSLAANASVRYQSAYKEAVAQGLSDHQASDAGLAAMPAAAIDALSDKIMGAATWSRSTTSLLKGSRLDKVKAIQQLSKDKSARGILLRASRDAFTEGAAEAVGDYVAGYGSYLATGSEEFLPSQEEMAQSFLVGAILGGGISLGGSVPGTIRGDRATLDNLEQEAAREEGGRFSDTQKAQEAFSLIGQGKYNQVLDILSNLEVTDVDVEADANISETEINVNSGEEQLNAFTPSDEAQELIAPSKENTDTLELLPFTSEEEKKSLRKYKEIPQADRDDFESEIQNQFNVWFKSDLDGLNSAINESLRSETNLPASGIRFGVFPFETEGVDGPPTAPGADYVSDLSRRVSGINFNSGATERSANLAVPFSTREAALMAASSPNLVTKIQEAFYQGRGQDITVIQPINDSDQNWLAENELSVLDIQPDHVVEADVEGVTVPYYYFNEASVNHIADSLDSLYGEGQWIVKSSVGSAGEGIYFSKEDMLAALTSDESVAEEPTLFATGMYAESLDSNLSNRPADQDYRVHLIKRGGILEVIPYATGYRFSNIPFAVRNNIVRTIESTALEYSNKLSEQVSENAILGVDVVMGADGNYIVTEANPTQGMDVIEETGNNTGASGYLTNRYYAASVYSHVKGRRAPAWVMAARPIMRKMMAEEMAERGPVEIATRIKNLIGGVRDAAQFKQELLKTYGESFSDSAERIWNAFKESAGQITQKIIDLIQSIINSVRGSVTKYTATNVNNSVMEDANTEVESFDREIERRQIGSRSSTRLRNLHIGERTFTNAGQLLAHLEVNNRGNLSKLVGGNQKIRSFLDGLPVFAGPSGYYGSFIEIDPNSGDLLRTIEHELFHAISETGLRSNPQFNRDVTRYLNDTIAYVRENHPIISQVYDIGLQAYQESGSKLDLAQYFAANISDVEADLKKIQGYNGDHAHLAYALMSPSEFISGLSDPQFREIVQSVPQSLFQRIINSIVRFFGGITSTTLDEVEGLVLNLVESDYTPSREFTGLIPKNELTSKRIRRSLSNLRSLKSGRINDNYDSNTSRILDIIGDLRASEIMKLSKKDQERVYDLIDNIYNARSIKTENPSIRIDTELLLDDLDTYRKLIDSKYIQERIKDLDGILDLSGYQEYAKEHGSDNPMWDRNMFNTYVNEIEKSSATQQELVKNRNAKQKQRYEKKQEKFRVKFMEMRQILQGIPNYFEYFNLSPRFKEFAEIHLDYIANIADVSSMEGMELYSHFFAINNLIDGRMVNGNLTAKYIARIRDGEININSLRDKFRDPLIKNGRGFWGAVDKANQATEIAQVRLDRWSAFIEGKDFLQNDLMGPLYQTLLTDSENAQRKAVDDYVNSRKEILQGRDFTGEDSTVMAITSRLISFEAGQDPNQAILKNIENERQAITNIIGDGQTKGKGDASLQNDYKERIIPIFEQIIQGIEDVENPMQVFRDSLNVRMGLGDPAIGQQRADMLSSMQDIMSRFSEDMEFISEMFYNKPFKKVINYLPRSAVPVEPTQKNTREESITDPIQQFEESNYQSSSTTAMPFQLESRTGIGKHSHYINNIEHVFERGVRVSAITANTTAERFILKNRISEGSTVSNLINGSDTTYRVKQLESWASGLIRNAMQSSNPLGKPGEILRAFSGAYARVALSSFHQGITQSVSGYTDYQIRTGNILGAMQASLFYIKNKDMMDQWFNDNSQRIVNRSYLGEQELDRRRTVNLDQKAIENLPQVKALKKIYDKAGDIITFSLRKGDDFTIRGLVLAEYHRLLKQKNPNIDTIHDVDWDVVEGDILTQATLNIERNVNASNKITRGDFFTDRNGGTMVIRQTLFAFSQQVMQLAGQLNLAVRDLYDIHQQGGSDVDKARAIRTIGGVIAQALSFSASKYVINSMLAGGIISLIRDMFDDEEGKIAELSMDLEMARMTGDDVMVAQAQAELNSAIQIRKTIEKFGYSQMSFESFFKNTLKESLGTMHFVFNGPAIPQKLVFNVVDTMGEQMVKETKSAHVSELKERIKEAKKFKQIALVGKLTEELTLIESQEWLPFEFDQTQNVGMGGVLGSALGGIYSTLDEFTRYGAGLTEININDFVLAAQSAGLGQADLNRMFRVIDRIEDDEFRRGRTFQEETLPKAKEREAEQRKRRLDREHQRFLNDLLNS